MYNIFAKQNPLPSGMGSIKKLQRIVNVIKIEKCAKCNNEIPLYSFLYKKKMVAPEVDRVYCCQCGKGQQND